MNLCGRSFASIRAALDEAGDERPRARERVEDVDALAAERLSELRLEDVLHAVEDEVDDLHRRVHDAQALGHLGERVAEELVVQLDDDLLLALRALDALRAQLHRIVEARERVGFLLEAVLLEQLEDVLHRHRDRVLGRERVTREQRLEDRLGHEVLREHLDHLVVRDAVVQVVSQFIGKARERLALPRVRRVLEDAPDAIDVRARDLRDVLGPVLPVVPVAHLLNQLRVDGALHLADLELELPLLRRRRLRACRPDRPAGLRRAHHRFVLRRLARLARHLVGDRDDLHLRAVLPDQVELVHHRVEAIVV